MSVDGVNAYQTDPLFVQPIGSSAAEVAAVVSTLLVKGRPPTTIACWNSSFEGWASPLEANTRPAVSRSNTATVCFIVPFTSCPSYQRTSPTPACVPSIDVSIPLLL